MDQKEDLTPYLKWRVYNNQLKAIYTKGWFYMLAVTIRGIERASHQKSYPDRWRGGTLQVRHKPALPSPSSNFRFFFFFPWQFSLTLSLCFVCTVWGSDKSQMSKIQEEHSVPVSFFICFHSHERLRCSGVQVQLSKFASESVSEPNLKAKPFRLVILPIIYVQVQWFILQSVWKDRLLTWIIGSVLQWSIYFKIAKKHIFSFLFLTFLKSCKDLRFAHKTVASLSSCLSYGDHLASRRRKKKVFNLWVFFC